ncbi:MAG TPA: gamma-glutamyltransferase [Pirellulales bacterium]|nr:gamma-glutamyltransferase [Pirellulales bacterium]
MQSAKRKAGNLSSSISQFAICVLTCLHALTPTKADEFGTAVEVSRQVVVCDSAPASRVGLEILKQGGNAVDAAVATALAMAVTFPEAGNLGGGGFMLVYPGKGKEPVCIEYRETAPAAAQATMFSLDDSQHGHKIVGVPGTVRGLELAHRRFGKLPWRSLVEPAVRLAEEGFTLGAPLAAALNDVVASSPDFPELQRVFGKDEGRDRWQAADRLVQKDLAQTLGRIAERGSAGFYEGETARLLVAEMQAGGGLITAADLAGYRAHARTPIRGTFRGYEIYGAPPPSSGGIGTIEALNILENFNLGGEDRWSPKTLHLLVETMRRVFCDRARYLGDPDFTKIPAKLVEKDYARELARAIDLERATPSEQLAPEIRLAGESESTTHFSIVDADGMAVANTYTLEHSYGSRVVVRGAGFLLNNEMGDFNWRPGHTDRQGRIGSEANQIAPGKRMLSSQTPTIVVRDGRPVLVTGSPGGRTIINTVVCVLVNVLEYRTPLREAIDAPRLHHQWFPNAIRFEEALESEHPAALERLREMGHQFAPKPSKQGSANSIWIDARAGSLQGVVDTRRAGAAAGE